MTSHSHITTPFEHLDVQILLHEDVGPCIFTLAAKVKSESLAPLFFSRVQKPDWLFASVKVFTHLQNSVVEVLGLVGVHIVSGSTDRYDLHMRAGSHLFNGGA